MGCSSSETALSVEDMEAEKRKYLLLIEDNNFKIRQCDNEITKLDEQIKKGEADIKVNQYQYSQDEINNKIQKLISLKRDRARIQKNKESSAAFNENAKNNCDNLDRKIEEFKNMKQMRRGNDMIQRIQNENHEGILQNNINGLNQAKQESELITRMVQRGNDQYIGSDVLMNEAEYKRQLLGTPYPK